MPIRPFTERDNDDTKNCFLGNPLSRKCSWKKVSEAARETLIFLHAARDLKALMAVPGYRLELLGPHGKKQNKRLAGFYSIRINQRWRVVFRWTEHAVADAEVALAEEEAKIEEGGTEGDGRNSRALEIPLGASGLPVQPELVAVDQTIDPAKTSEEAHTGADQIQPIEQIGGLSDDVEFIDYH